MTADGSETRTIEARTLRIEWPTVMLTLAIYGGFVAVTWFWQSIPMVLLVALGGWVIAWHGSLQHEVLHGHPTRIRAVNSAIGWVPLSLWLPYAVYRESHLIHHRNEFLTDPIEDPESSYVTQAAWAQMGSTGQALARFNMTLFGRLTLGPLVMILSFLVSEFHLVQQGVPGRAGTWGLHLVGVVLVLLWVVVVCGMPLWLYLLGFVYLGAALTRLRSFAEHKFADSYDERTAIVENTPLFGLLYLYNNLHVLHHQRPAMPWYRLPGTYRKSRDELVALNGGLVYNGYFEIVRRFFLTPHDTPRHPQR